MPDTRGVLDRVVDALTRGDREAALECFAPGAMVVLSGSHHDYASYAPSVVIDGLLHSFMEISWTPSSRQVLGGAQVDDGVVAATHIGRFLGSDPSAGRVAATVRLTSSVTPTGHLEMLSVWGSRDDLVAAMGLAGDGDGPWEEPSRAEVEDPEMEGLPAVADVVSAAARTPRRVMRPRLLGWAAAAVAAVVLLVIIVLGARSLLSTADAVAGTITTFLASSSDDAAAPPIVEQTAHQALSQLGGPDPLNRTSVGSSARLAPVGPDISFPSDSVALTAAGAAQVDDLAATITRRGLAGAIYVRGFAEDTTGSAERTALVSSERAAVVARALQERLHGQPVRLVVAGLGAQDPLAQPSAADNAATGAYTSGETGAETGAVNHRVVVLYRPPV